VNCYCLKTVQFTTKKVEESLSGERIVC